MTGRRSNRREDRDTIHYSSSCSESSFSRESDVESSSDSASDVSSDGLELGLHGKNEAQQKFKRLRRIFLNRPTKAKKKTNSRQHRRKHDQIGRDKYHLERRSSTSIGVAEQCHSLSRPQGSISSNSSIAADDRALDRLSEPTDYVRPLQAAIDQHMTALAEQMKRHSAQRDSTANQVQSMLEQAVDELQFLKKQEERALETQVRLIRESYALRLEVFQQQYLNKVAEIEDEMYASIQTRQGQCDATILTAAKKLQDQTQHALLKDFAIMNSEPIEEQLDTTSFSTSSNSVNQSKAQRQRSVQPLRRDTLSSQASRVVPMVKQASPISKQRAKLQALEEKLAAFSPESLNRVKNKLATPICHNKAERTRVKSKRTPYSRSTGQSDSPNEAVGLDADEWGASPLSPLRKGPSYWKNGISLETRDGEDSFYDKAGNSSKSDHLDETSTSNTIRRRAPASLLSRRFLRPEEEEELRHLRASIGLAKDWMAKNSQV